tara:strand:+ start:246 stop:1109 length:864 start_codon:yes stop_codon:yes gene_type:complete
MNKRQKKRILEEKKNLKIHPYHRLFSFFFQLYLNTKEWILLRYNRIQNKDVNFFNDPLITIYTPTFNRANILKSRAIKSVLKQTYKNFEYIIVSDGSSDNTEQIVKSFKDKRIRFFKIKRKILYKKNIENLWFAGPVRPNNYALKKTNGKWLAKIDDDVVWHKDHLKRSLKFCKKRNLEFMTSASKAIRFKKEVPAKPYKINNCFMGGSNTFFYKSYLKFFKFNIHCWKKSINRVNDIDLFDRISKVGAKIGYSKKINNYIYPRPNEQTIGFDQLILKKKEYEKKYF